ncbi:MAG: response regulator [Myxococcota bacterium]|nr:response regulator [Myxococcota bacterium]
MEERPGAILLVEDDRDIRESFQDLLELSGFRLQVAENGRQALDQLAQDPLPAVVLLDMMLPIVSGNEVLAAMRQSDRLARVPVVILSTGTRLMDAKDRARYASTYGVSAVLPKPVDPVRLLEILHRLIPSAVAPLLPAEEPAAPI